jgi:hypothetical protein
VIATRRKFFGFIAASPLAGRAAAQQMAERLSGIPLTAPGGMAEGGVSPTSAPDITHLQWRALLKLPEARAAIVSEIYKREHKVYRIDHDLGVKRSFSLAAKIAYQRERNVAHELELLTEQYPWQRIQNAGRKFLSMIGLAA